MNTHVLWDILASGKVVTSTGEELPLHSHIPALECQIVQRWIQSYHPRRIVEVGLAYGISSLAICDALEWSQETLFHAIDPYQHREWRGIGLLNLERAGYGQAITFHEEPSQTVLPKLLQQGISFDCAFIDGSHDEANVRQDVVNSDALLHAGGLLLLDDVQLPGVRAAVEHLTTHLGYYRLPIPHPFQNAIPIRVRRLNGVPESRVVGLRKP